MNGDLYNLVKSYQHEQRRQAAGERSWRVKSVRRRSSLRNTIITVANFIATFF